MLRAAPLLVFLALTALLAYALLSPPPPPQGLTGSALPALTLPVHRADNAEPGPMLINLFASWCAPCIAELPVLQTIEGLRVVGIAWKDKPQALDAWLAKYGDPYDAIYLDTNGHYGVALGMRGVPESFLVDAQGMIRYHHVGVLTEADKTKIEGLLESLP